MDISLIKENSLKIKGGRSGTTIVTDPVSKVEAEILLLTDRSAVYDLDKVEGKKLVIEGPGEYELGGISIVTRVVKGEMVFVISNSGKILLLPASAVSKMQEEDEYDAVIIKVNGKIDEDVFSMFNTKCTILYGDVTQVQVKTEKKESVSKVNIKKTSEIQGKIFLLS